MNRILKILVILFIPTVGYTQVDTLKKTSIKSWEYTDAGIETEILIDTSLNGFQKVNPIFKNTLFANYIGNNSSPSQSLLFFDRNDDPRDFFFGRSVNIFYTNPRDVKYYNTNKPFTEIGHSAGGPKNESEQILTGLHTQNVNPNFNIGIKFDLYSSKGRYLNNLTKGNFLTAFTSIKKGNYQIHANASYNNLEQGENGGIDSLSFLGSDDYSKSINIPVKLSEDSRSQIKNKSIFFEHGFEFKLRKPKILEKKEKGKENERYTFERKMTFWKDSIMSVFREYLGIDEINDSLNIYSLDRIRCFLDTCPDFYWDNLMKSLESDSMLMVNNNHLFHGDDIDAKDKNDFNNKRLSYSTFSLEIDTASSYLKVQNSVNYIESQVKKMIRQEIILAEEEKQKELDNIPRIGVKHRFLYEYDIRKYVDESLDGKDTLFYDYFNNYIDFDIAHDEARRKLWHNKISIDYNSENLFFQVGYNNYWTKYRYNINPDSTFFLEGDTINWDTTIMNDYDLATSNSSYSYEMNGKLFNALFYESNGEYFFNGYREKDLIFEARAGIKLPWLDGKLGSIWASYKYTDTRADYFQEHFTSKYFKWDTSFSKVQKKIVQFDYINSKYDLSVGAKFGEVDNYLYFDSTANISQFKNPINVTEFHLTKNFHFWKLHLYNTAKYQISSNDSILTLPTYIINSSWYIQHHFHFESTGGDLLTQLGFDFQYYSRYNADRYMPTTGIFIAKDKIIIGEYPYFDVFLNLKLKSFRLSVIYSNLIGLFNKTDYFTSPYYPASPATLKFNLVWTFYD